MKKRNGIIFKEQKVGTVRTRTRVSGMPVFCRVKKGHFISSSTWYLRDKYIDERMKNKIIIFLLLPPFVT